jgi:four helix bundle protein
MKFDAHTVAGEIVRAVGPMLERVRAADTDLAKQLKRAAQSVLLNVGEGSRRLGRDRVHCFAVASGSARETRDAIEIAEAWGYVRAEETRVALELLDRELAMLWRLTHGAGG